MTVTATNAAGSSTIQVTIRLVPWVYLTGDLQGQKADIGNGGVRRDLIGLDFVRTASVLELRQRMAVFYDVNWSTTDPDLDLVNTEELVAAGRTDGSVTFEAGRRYSSVPLTPRQDTLTRPMSTFDVTLQSRTPNYVVMAEAAKLNRNRDWGQAAVTCTIFPRTTLFASDNANAALRDVGPGNGININDIMQGWIGDCYFLADLAALAFRDPAAIRNMFTDLGGGRYRVTFTNFGSRQQQSVEVSLDLEFGISQAKFLGDYTEVGGEKTYEIWPQILEKAYSQWVGRANFVNGDGCWSTMIRLTGREPTYTDMTQLAPGARNAFRTALIQQIRDSKIIVAYSGSHAWAVKDYDAAADRFVFFDPNNGDGDLQRVSWAEFFTTYTNLLVL